MTVGDIITSDSIKDKYISYLSAYTSFVWSQESHPNQFKASTLGESASVVSNLDSPNASDIINAVSSITDVVRLAAKSLTAIVTCRFRAYLNTNGTYILKFDQTQKALFNSNYLVNLSFSQPNSKDIIYESKLNEFFQSIQDQVATAQSRYYDISQNYCHCLSAKTSSIDIKTFKNDILSKETVSIPLSHIAEHLKNCPDTYVSTSSGFSKILNVFNNGEKELYRVKFKNSIEFIDCTLDHKLFYSEKECKQLKDYKISEAIFGSNKTLIIASIEYLEKNETCDIEVDNEFHNFYCNGVLVSNSSCHSSCFSGETQLDLMYKGSKIKMTFKELSIALFTNSSIFEYQIKTPEGYKNIKNFYRNGIKDIYLVNKEIECTLDHKFVVNLKSNKKIAIHKLVGKNVCLTDNTLIKISSIEYSTTDITYDIEVDSEYHRYIINETYVVSNCHGSRGRR